MATVILDQQRVHLAYGREGLDLEFPPGYDYQILEAKSTEPLSDPVAYL